MKTRKLTKTLAASALCATALIGGLGATNAFAQDGSNSSKNSTTTQFAKAAPSAEEIAKHQAERKADLKTKLDEQVKSGAITQDQADALTKYFEDNAPKAAPDKNATKEEREAERDTRKAALEKFASENNISTTVLDVIRPAKGPGGHGGPGGKGGTPPTAEERKAKLEEKLSTAVSEGKITQAQADKVSEFMEANAPKAAPDMNATKEEREAEHASRRAEFEKFASENGVPSDLLKPIGKEGPK